MATISARIWFAVMDVAGFAALMLERREPFLGRRIDIASDGPAGREMAEIQSRVTGRTVEDVELPVEAVRVRSHDLALMFEWFDRVGYSADVQPCVVSAPTSAGTRPRRGRGHASSTVGTDSVR